MPPSVTAEPIRDAVQTSKKPAAAPPPAILHGVDALPGIPAFDDAAQRRQWQLEHMATVFRVFARNGYTEGMSGHISVRDPERANAFWINPLGVHWALSKASDMVMVNQDGEVLGGNSSSPFDDSGFLIHSTVYAARPDVNAICHAHTVHGKAWSVFARPLDMLTQDVCDIFNAHGVYTEYGGVVSTAEEGRKIATALGRGKGCILMNHGLMTVGATVDEAGYLFGMMERSCQVQLLVESAGLPKQIIPDEQAALNFKLQSTPENLFREFQPYYQYEEAVSGGNFKY